MDDMLQRIYKGGLTRSQRHELVEEYKHSQAKKGETLKPGKRVNLSSEDPLNRPRHQVVHYCPAFEECPLCYKCRSYNSAHEACRKCVLTEQSLLCKRDLHTPSVLSRMIRRERIDLDFGKFEIHYETEEGLGLVRLYKVPDGRVIHYDEERGTTDFEPLRDYIGRTFEYFLNGKSKGERVLTDVSLTEEGIRCFQFRKPDGVDDDGEV